jgi:hypothetical protein
MLSRFQQQFCYSVFVQWGRCVDAQPIQLLSMLLRLLVERKHSDALRAVWVHYRKRYFAHCARESAALLG